MKTLKLFSLMAIVSALFMVGSFTSCSSSSDPVPVNDGKIDPSTVATANLVAYFPFEGTGVEQISSITPVAQPNVTYVAGRRGQCYQGVNQAYFLYDLPAASKIRTLKTFALAMWLYEPQIPQETAPVPMMFQIKNDDDLFWGNISLTQDRMGTATAPLDSLNLKMVMLKQGAPWNMQWLTPISTPVILASRWMHIVFEYDNVTSKFNVYKDGALLSFPASLTDRFSDAKDANGNQPALGDLSFNKPSQLVIGGWLPKILNNATDEWMGFFLGKMDEVRLYDRALTTTEVKSLYDAEITQLN